MVSVKDLRRGSDVNGLQDEEHLLRRKQGLLDQYREWLDKQQHMLNQQLERLREQREWLEQEQGILNREMHDLDTKGHVEEK